jgi:hypothetical protein
VVENRLVGERSFLLVFFLAEPLRVTPLNVLQANAHSGAIPKSFSSSESQLHGGACLGVFFVDGIVGIIENGEIRCLMSVMMVGVYIVYYNVRIIIHSKCLPFMYLFLFLFLFCDFLGCPP